MALDDLCRRKEPEERITCCYTCLLTEPRTASLVKSGQKDRTSRLEAKPRAWKLSLRWRPAVGNKQISSFGERSLMIRHDRCRGSSHLMLFKAFLWRKSQVLLPLPLKCTRVILNPYLTDFLQESLVGATRTLKKNPWRQLVPAVIETQRRSSTAGRGAAP
ncbi:uncharacterized protein LOC121828254 isoform X1 [Peromyscus maniculatus bairdii]|uniref:uncharacterized protein LOC121828254 isoform X1 n=1 Tax=Peromyscus maniculatus bairdii TaxID=230844 RepID=UPI003FD5A374